MAVEFDHGRFATRAAPDEPVIVRDEPVTVRDQSASVREEDVYEVPGPGTTVPDARSERAERREEAYRRLGDGAYALLRITVGAVMLAHGLLKLEDTSAWVETVRSLGVPMPSTMALLSLTAEVGGGVALILGLLTRLGAMLLFFNMLGAIVLVHAGHGLFAQHGGYEHPLVLLMTSVLIAAEGSRRYGIDGSLWRAIRRRRAASSRSANAPRHHRFA